MLKELWGIAQTSWGILAGLWWFIALAIVIAAVISTLRLDQKVAGYLKEARAKAMLGAMLLGLVSPL